MDRLTLSFHELEVARTAAASNSFRTISRDGLAGFTPVFEVPSIREPCALVRLDVLEATVDAIKHDALSGSFFVDE